MIEKWNEYAKYTNKPISDLVELNIRTINHWMNESKNFTAVLQTKNPIDFFSAQTKLMNDANLEVMRYMQEASDIGFESASQTNKIISNSIKESTEQASDMQKETSRIKKK